MPDRQHILRCIAATVRKLGRTPSRSEFISRSGISEYYISRFFSTWHVAVRAAGFEPRNFNVLISDNELLKDWGESARKNRAQPSRRAYRRLGKYDLRTLERRFGRWSLIPRAFANFAKRKPEWADVVALLPATVPYQRHGRRRATSDESHPANLARVLQQKKPGVYGNPIEFPAMRHEPVNEQGVVLLFGMLAQKLGYFVEAVQNGFPDCEAKRQISASRWQRVLIEFEFESRNFRDHAHPSAGCDVIVCWRHNWPDCPSHLEVVELSSVIKCSAHTSS
jgi:hypothetical protein